MNTKKNYPYHVIFRQNEDLDDAMSETSESVVNRICALFGFSDWAVSMVEGDLDSAEIAGTRYYVHTAVRFTANGIGWSTDFENLVRDPVLDEQPAGPAPGAAPLPRGSPITIRGDVPYRCRAGGEAPKASDKKRAARCGKRGRLQT